MIDPLRIAVIGAGGMGREHMRQISLAPDADLIAVSDVDFDAAQRAADEFGARAVVGLVDRLADTGLDGVVVASTDETHADITLAALGAGVPVLCEKPLAHTVAAARQVVDAEVGLGRRLVQVGFMRVYDPAHVELAEAIADLGPVHYVRCVHRNRQPVVRPAATVLVQSVIHDVHTVRWLAGAEIVEVSTIARPRAGGVRYIHVTARLASGGIATIEFDDLSYAYEVAVEVTAEMGIVTTSGPIAPFVRTAGSVGAAVGDDWFGRFIPAYRNEMRAWLDGVRAGHPVVGPDVWDGFVAQEVVAAAMRSLEAGRPSAVDLPTRPPIYTRS